MNGRTPQQAYLGLQKLARAEGRATQQLFELYVHERFLARLAASRFAERLVLKGGMLLAVLDARRATRDADMLARGIANNDESLRQVVGEIARIELVDGAAAVRCSRSGRCWSRSVRVDSSRGRRFVCVSACLGFPNASPM